MRSIIGSHRLLSYSQRVNRLRLFTSLFFFMLFLPLCLIFSIGFNQFEKDILTQHQQQAEEVISSINMRFYKRIMKTNEVHPEQYSYYRHLYNPFTKELTKSLSQLSEPSYYDHKIGQIGYFQIDWKGRLTSPAWPFLIGSEKDSHYVKKDHEPSVLARRDLLIKLNEITSQSEELKKHIGNEYEHKYKRFHIISDLPDYFIFYRYAEINDQSYLQGNVFYREKFITRYIELFLSKTRFQTPILLTLTPDNPQAETHYYLSKPKRNRKVDITKLDQIEPKYTQLTNLIITEKNLNWPFKDYTVTFSVESLELTSAAIYSGGLMAVLFIALAFGCIGFYRNGVNQIKLAEQQLNFVSSVSHELKTPLTSIRMYAEMLKTGTINSDEHKGEYYDFIHSESERLSRLIDNILQLSKLNQPHHKVDLAFIKLPVAINIIESKLSSMVEKNGFTMNLVNKFDQPDNIDLWMDIDAFSQVVINITDNAIKFFDREHIQDTERRKINFTFSQSKEDKDSVSLEIRDFGNGITAKQESKIFDLFYRGESELTRSTKGTGIGLALVHELMLAQEGKIEVVRKDPGVAFVATFRSIEV